MLIEIAPFSPDFPNFQKFNSQAADMTRLLHNELVQKHAVEIIDDDQSVVVKFLEEKSVGRNMGKTLRLLETVTQRLNESFFNLEFTTIKPNVGGDVSNEVIILFEVKKPS